MIQSANQEYYSGNISLACRKYEEAYSIWRYFKIKNSSNKDAMLIDVDY